MIRILRAAGFAAAAVAFVAAACSPSLAVDLKGAPEAGIMAHDGAQLEESDLALNHFAPKPAALHPVAAAAPVSFILQRAVAWLGRDDGELKKAPANPRGLDELVEAFAGNKLTDGEEKCLANAVYFEARGEPIQGQLAVAQVVLNRAASGRYPASWCEVITQKAQFSFIRRGRFPKADKSSEAWRKAVAIAHIAKAGLVKEIAPDVLWYHATYVSPSWGRRLNRETQIGLHIFYS